ncbi:9463_t:CDS:1, partial [Cetraspora pellucida]
LINVVKAGLYYRKPKDGKFMQNHKERIKKLRQAKDPEEYILNSAMTIFPNEDKYNKTMNDCKAWYGNDSKIYTSIMELYKLYYNLAKDYFIKEVQIDKEAEDFLNL